VNSELLLTFQNWFFEPSLPGSGWWWWWSAQYDSFETCACRCNPMSSSTAGLQILLQMPLSLSHLMSNDASTNGSHTPATSGVSDSIILCHVTDHSSSWRTWCGQEVTKQNKESLVSYWPTDMPVSSSSSLSSSDWLLHHQWTEILVITLTVPSISEMNIQ
jgi:hypothetical protein